MSHPCRIVGANRGLASRRLVTCLFATLFSGLFLPVACGQNWIKPGGVGGPPPNSFALSTNRLDLDVNGATDFEIVTRQDTTYEGSLFGWVPRTTTSISLVPRGGSRILASDQHDQFVGDVPVLTENDPVGPAKAGQRWSAAAHTLVIRSEPMFLVGPLGPVWAGVPGKYFLGVSLGTPEAPLYAWLCFTSGFVPSYWGYAREASVAVVAGDRSTAPPLQMKVRLLDGPRPGLKSTEISWEPGFPEVTVEERVGASGTWSPVVDSTNPGWRIPMFSVPVDAQSPAGELRLYRVRFGP